MRRNAVPRSDALHRNPALREHHQQAIPLELAELGEAYEITRAIPATDEAEAGFQLPNPTDLPSAAAYQTLLEQLASLERGLEPEPNLWASSSQHSTALEEAEVELEQALEQVEALEPWLRHVVEAAINGGLHAQPWRQLIELLETTPAEIARHQLRLAQVDVEIPTDHAHDELLEVCGEISESLRAGAVARGGRAAASDSGQECARLAVAAMGAQSGAAPGPGLAAR